eukprot:TRINITY_DN13016_c0_g1_i1.p1 TRINITY_DN13016_c0_g1~~TRINITY_DN13016_c0_g1_i1.p1  ORF type:complete len:762 (+),score=178.79 TRINITY_DN13016_c0_g1_i1:158-2443(+)
MSEEVTMSASRLRMPEYRGRASMLPRSPRNECDTPAGATSTRSERSGLGARASCGGFGIEAHSPVRQDSNTGRSLAGNFADAGDVSLSATSGALPVSDRNRHIRVAVRVRPLPPNEEGIIEVANSGAIAIRKDAATGGNEFLSSQRGRVEERAFDQVFGPEATQKEVYSWTCTPILSDAVSKGRSATVFVYGATGAGKTHTMFGGFNQEDQGIIFRAIPEVFAALEEHRLAASSAEVEADMRFEVKVSFLEIYNEVVRDLLQEGGGNGTCKVLEDERRGLVKVANLVEALVHDPSEAIAYLRAGMQARTVEATAANSQSSRAHAVFSLTIEQVKFVVGTGPFAHKRGTEVRQLHSKISLIDLAGSERASFTQNTGNALKDGARINQSLLALANCIDALTAYRRDSVTTARKKPPYRDSKLTLMLKSSLTGDGMVAMIANVHPARRHFEDSNNTLEYAKRASIVRPVTNRRLSRAALPFPEDVPTASQSQPKLQVSGTGGTSTYDDLQEGSNTCGHLGASSSSASTAADRPTIETKSHKRTEARHHRSGDSAAETTSPEECLSEISLGSGGQESSEVCASPRSADEPRSNDQMEKEAPAKWTPENFHLEMGEASASGCSTSVSPPSSNRSNRQDSPELVKEEYVTSTTSATLELGPDPKETSRIGEQDASGLWHTLFAEMGRNVGDESSTLAVALKLVTKLQAQKASLDERLKAVTKERDALLQDRRDLENENAELRAADLEKDKQLGLLLARCSELSSTSR